MSPVRKVSKSQWVKVVGLILLDETMGLSDFDAEGWAPCTITFCKLKRGREGALARKVMASKILFRADNVPHRDLSPKRAN